MTGLLIALGVLIAIGFIPTGVYAKYDEDLTVFLTVLGIRIPLFPRKENRETAAEPFPGETEKREKEILFPAQSRAGGISPSVSGTAG